MVQNMATALKALHYVLVAARNIAIDNHNTPALFEIVDWIESIPILMADPIVDHTDEIIRRYQELASQYPECRLAGVTVETIKNDDKA